jgi:hypothetical protein
MRLAKKHLRLERSTLSIKLQTEFQFQPDVEALEETLKRLSELQYVTLTPEIIEYVP